MKNAKELFWKLHKESKLCSNKKNLNKKHGSMSAIVNNYWEQFNNEDDKFYKFYLSFKNGEYVKNKFGKVLYFKKASENNE